MVTELMVAKIKVEVWGWNSGVEMSCKCFVEDQESAESNIVQMLNESEKIVQQTKKSETDDLEAALRLKEVQKKELQVLKMMQSLK